MRSKHGFCPERWTLKCQGVIAFKGGTVCICDLSRSHEVYASLLSRRKGRLLAIRRVRGVARAPRWPLAYGTRGGVRGGVRGWVRGGVQRWYLPK